MPAAALASAAMPGQCELCRQWTRGALCADCLARFVVAVPRCARCGLRLGVAAAACGDCLREPPPFERTVCAVDYAFPWSNLVAGLKFHDRAELAALLAGRLAEAVRAAEPPSSADLLLPVPLAPGRLRQRGYNQAWEIARRLGAALRIEARADLLLRPLETDAQAELDRVQRQRNLRAAFMVDARQRTRLQGRRVALVDDVMTTGATAREAALALLRGGAAEVDLWVVARTPRPD